MDIRHTFGSVLTAKTSIFQEGKNNRIEVLRERNGRPDTEGIEAVISQLGTDHTATIVQRGTKDSKASITQEGAKNEAEITQWNSSASLANITQRGNNLNAKILQGYGHFEGSIDQEGSYNVAGFAANGGPWGASSKFDIRQRGVENIVSISNTEGAMYSVFNINQEGNKNRADVIGDEASDINVVQVGNFNSTLVDDAAKDSYKNMNTVRQEGNNNEAKIRRNYSHFGKECVNMIHQVGDNNKADISFFSGSDVNLYKTIYQVGFNNSARISVEGFYISLPTSLDKETREITQVGNSNIASIEGITIRGASINSTSRITQQGNANVALIAENMVYGNTTAINQMGNRNVADVELRGNSNTFTLNQLGDGNVYSGVITGSGSTVVINQP